MLPSDPPLTEDALALLASSFRPVTADHMFQSFVWNYSKCAMPGTRKYPPAKPGALVCEPLEAVLTEPQAFLATPEGVRFIYTSCN